MRKVLCLMLIAIMLLSVGCSAAVSVVDANINEDGHLVLSMNDGNTIDAGYAKGDKGDQGEKGIDGKDGRDGIDGVDGVGIKKAVVNDSGHLMIRLTDDTLIDTGYVIGADGKDGRDGVDGRDGRDGADGRDGVDGSNGIDGKTPYIGDNGNWWIGEEDTGVKAKTTDFIFNDSGNGTLLLAYVGHDTDVVIPEKATRICEGAFMNNRVISTVEIPDNVTTINESAFENCTSLKEVILPEGLSALGANAFSNCDSLEKAYIPYSLITSEEWEQYTFAHCSSLEAITWGNAAGTVKPGYIPGYSFYECSNLDVDAIPAYIQYIFQYAFAKSGISGELSLTCILDRYAFAECKNITSVIITMYDSMSIRTGVFASCYNLERVEFVIPDVLTGGQYSSTSVVFQIGELAFSGCNKLDTIILPDDTSCTLINEKMGVKWAIFDSAFDSTGFKNITLPSTISHIDYRTFADCSIESFTLKAEIPPYLAEAAFENTPLVFIYVPAASVDAYKAADGWKDYADKIQAIS